MKYSKQYLIENFANSVSQAAEFARENSEAVYPERIKKPILAPIHTAKEASDYARNLKWYDKEMVTYRSAKELYSEVSLQENAVFIEYMKEVAGLDTIPEQYRKKVWDKAWSDGHSSGYSEVYYHLVELIDIFNN